MNFFIFSIVTFVLFTISTVASQLRNQCAIDAAKAIADYTNLTSQSVAAAAFAEKNRIQATFNRIAATEASVAAKAKAVLDTNNLIVISNETPAALAARLIVQATKAAVIATKASVLIIGLRATEITRQRIEIAKASAFSLASTKYLVALNSAVVSCNQISALPTGFLNNSCSYNATNGLAKEIDLYAKFVTAAALTEKNTAQAAATRIAANKLLIVSNVEAVLAVNNATTIQNETLAGLSLRLNALAAKAAFVAVQADLMVSGLQTAENDRQAVVDTQAAADAIAEANYFVALNSAVVACNAISALTWGYAKYSCAYNTTVDIAIHIQANANNVTAAAFLERDTARAAAANIAKKAASYLQAMQYVLASNNLFINDAYSKKTIAEIVTLLDVQASTTAQLAINAANSRMFLISTEASRAIDAATLAAAKAIEAAVKRVALNAALAAC